MTDSEQFIAAVEHYCEGLIVSPGCRGSQCEYADGYEDHQCEASFSWHQCDSCGSRLGGDRTPASGIITGCYDDKETEQAIADSGKCEIIDLSICVDCVLFHANGDVPETWR